MTTPTEKYDVAVIGGGASGMMAAIAASRSGACVLLIEKNQHLGKKLRISGGGRCNITNAEPNQRTLLSHYGKAEQFLYSAFSKFDNQSTVSFFKDIGVPTKVEARNRAFPVSESADDVADALERELKARHVEIWRNTAVTDIQTIDGAIRSIRCGDKAAEARQFILATGGVSYPETGSTGDGFDWLSQLGHTIDPPTPNITPLSVKGSWVGLVAGKTAQDTQIDFRLDQKSAIKLRGGVLFTHFGLSGPTILNNASKVSELLEKGTVTAQIDLRPDVDEHALDKQIIKTLEENPSKQVKNVLSDFIPDGLTPLVIASIGGVIDLTVKTSEFSRVNRTKLGQTIKNVQLTIDDLMGFEKAVVADGGVSLKEIDMRTMRSSKVSNLFVTGDLLNINRPSGGYSLQLCWTTGFIAGTEAAKQKEQHF